MRSGVLTKLLASRLSTAMPAVLKSLKNPHKSAVFILFIVSGYFLVEDAFNVHCKYHYDFTSTPTRRTRLFSFFRLVLLRMA